MVDDAMDARRIALKHNRVRFSGDTERACVDDTVPARGAKRSAQPAASAGKRVH